MKKTISTFALLAVIGVLLMSYNGGVAGYNNAPTQTNCATSCHGTNPLNSAGGSITITDNIPATGYVPGTTYSINVTVARTGISKFGFGFEAVNSSNGNAGTLLVTNSALTKTLSGTRVNMTHLNNSGIGSGVKSFTFNWVAPAATNSTVTFYSSGNAANGNNSVSGDFIYTTTRTVSPHPVVTGSISGSPFCANTTSIAIPFIASGVFTPGNVFTAQLSDASGSFASPTVIGSVTATASGTISSTVPLPNVPGTGYRIRVVSSAPAITGIENSVNLSVIAPPTIASAGGNQSICGSSLALSANAAAIGTGSWSVISGSGTFAAASSPTTAFTALGSGTNVLRWTISNGNCPPSTSQFTLGVSLPPTTALAGANQTVCAGTASLSANTPVIGAGVWTVLSGTATLLSPNSASSNVVAIGNGITILEWSISNGTCPPSTSTLALNYTGSITVSNAGADQTVCANSATLAANTAVNGVGTWSVISGSGSFANSNNPTTSVSGLQSGNNVFRWVISNGACNPSTDDVSVTSVSVSPAVVMNNLATCGTNISISATAPVTGVGTWSVLSGSGSISAVNSATTSVSGISSGTNTFLWTVSNSPCADNTATLNVVQNGTISNAAAGSDQSICGFSLVLNATPVTIGTGSWSVVSGAANFASPTSAFSSVSGLSNGTNVLRWTVTNSTCTPLADDVVINTATVSTAAAGSNQTICASIATLVATAPQFGTGAWSVLSGTATIFSASSATTPIINLGNGTNVFRYTISNAPCANSVSDVTISNCVNNSIATSSISGSPFCANTSFAVIVNFSTTGIFPGFFTAQLSDASGSFSSPLAIGAGTSSPIFATLPSTLATGSAYRVRVVSSIPATTGSNNGTDLSINTCPLNYIVLDSLEEGPYCDYTTYDITIPFVAAGTASPPFRAQLSDASGSFANALSIGYAYTSPIYAHLPEGAPAGNNYKVRIKSGDNSIFSNESPNKLTINICLETGIRSAMGVSTLRFYPTETDRFLEVQSSSTAAVSIVITDLTGRKLVEQSIDNGKGKLDVSELPAQLYFISLSDGNQQIRGIFIKK